MKRLLFLLLLIPALSFGQSVYTYSGKAVTYGGDVVISVPSTYCTEYQAVYDAYTTKPSDEVAAIDNTFVAGLVSDGAWAKLDVAWVYASHTNGAGEALINWKLPGTYDATAYNAPTFTAYEGFLGDGNTQYIDCNWIPSVSGVNYIQNSASQIIYIRTDVTQSSSGHGTLANVDSKDCVIYPRTNSNNAQIRTNDALWKTDVNADGSGMFINTRTASDLHKLYRNKGVIINETNGSIGVPTHSPYCLAFNDNDVTDGFRADQVSFYAWGAGLTQTDVDNLTDRFETRMDALGTGVIAMIDPLEQLNDLMFIQYLAFQQRINNYENIIINNMP